MFALGWDWAWRMSKIMAWCTGVVLAGAITVGGPSATAASRGGEIGSWGKAIEVPGLAALNTGRDASVTTMSCVSAGNCAAGGDYSDRHGDFDQGFVAVERNGRWGTAIEVPGLAALDKDGYFDIGSVSCASAGNCAVGGYYTFNGGDQGAFVATERNGRWAKAIAVPGLAALSKRGDAGVSEVSCGSAGSCAGGGLYIGASGGGQGFVTQAG